MINLKVLPIEKLLDISFAFTDISVTYRTPYWSALDGYDEPGRTVNGFLLVDHGACRYEWKNGNAELVSGGLIYLSLGSRKRMEVTEKPFSYYNINFTVTDLCDGEGIIFDKDPLVIAHSASRNIFESCKTMLSSTMSRSGGFLSCSNLMNIFDTIYKYHIKKSDSRIHPAVQYIEENYTNEISIEFLSKLCFMSQAHFFRLFKEEFGVSPVEYKNNLKIDRAKLLLRENECTVSEVADILRFDSVQYFSRFFKKHVGVPPSEYTTFKL